MLCPTPFRQSAASTRVFSDKVNPAHDHSLLSCSKIDRILNISQALLHVPNEQGCLPALSRAWVYSSDKPTYPALYPTLPRFLFMSLTNTLPIYPSLFLSYHLSCPSIIHPYPTLQPIQPVPTKPHQEAS